MLTFIEFNPHPKAKDSKERDTVRDLLSKPTTSKTNEMILTWFGRYGRYAYIHEYMYIYAFSLLTCASYSPII